MLMLKLHNHINHIMKEKNITQLQLSEMTGIRQAGISELLNLKRQSINLKHLELIINVLGIKDIEKCFTIENE